MRNLHITSSPEVEKVFNTYPDRVRDKIINLRKLIIETANDIAEIKHIEETLKWGEPSYLVKNGSTLRIHWKKNKPDQYAMYFKCTSRLVSTFKARYGHIFNFEGNRAIVFQMNAHKIPEVELKKCIAVGLTYHKVKHLSMLGL